MIFHFCRRIYKLVSMLCQWCISTHNAENGILERGGSPHGRLLDWRTSHFKFVLNQFVFNACEETGCLAWLNMSKSSSVATG